jgi:hypothetical protein
MVPITARDGFGLRGSLRVDRSVFGERSILVGCLLAVRLLVVLGISLWQSELAWSRGVSFADLQGAVVEATFVTQNTGRGSIGREFSVRVQNSYTITIGPGNTIHASSVGTQYLPTGPQRSAPSSGSYVLAQARQLTSGGGGQAMWAFENGELTFRRTFKAGGYSRTIAFTRTPGGLICSFNAFYAREVGVGEIKFESRFSHDMVVMTSVKPVSSTCRVIKH